MKHGLCPSDANQTLVRSRPIPVAFRPLRRLSSRFPLHPIMEAAHTRQIARHFPVLRLFLARASLSGKMTKVRISHSRVAENARILLTGTRLVPRVLCFRVFGVFRGLNCRSNGVPSSRPSPPEFRLQAAVFRRSGFSLHPCDRPPIKLNQAKSNQIKPNQTKSNQTKPSRLCQPSL